MNKQGLVNFFEKNDLRLGALLFVLAVFFTHAPFFLYIPVPAISMDSFNYYWFAKEIFDGKLPVIDQPHDFPWGYPFFLFLVKYCGGNLLTVAFIQTLVFVLASSFLISQLSKTIKYGGLIAAFSLVLFAVQPHTIRHNIALNMESLYISGLIVLAGSVVAFFRRKDTLAFAGVVVGVLWVMLIRPNGIAMLSIPFFLIGFAYWRKLNCKPFWLILGGLVLFNIAGNYVFKGKASFGDSKRIEKVIRKFQKRYKTVVKYKSDVAPTAQSHTLGNMAKRYFMNPVLSKPSFYYSLQQTNYHLVVTKNMAQDTTLEMFDGRALVDTFSPNLRKFIFEGYAWQQYDKPAFSNIVQYNFQPRNKWMLVVHIVYELFNKLKVAYIIYFGFWCVLFYSFYQVLVLKSRSDFWLMFLILAMIHLVSLVLLPFLHNSFQARYIYVSEFIVYLGFFIGMGYFLVGKNDWIFEFNKKKST